MLNLCPLLVLIESDWNLKDIELVEVEDLTDVLIESDWNLKIISASTMETRHSVLIESDWNLKKTSYRRHYRDCKVLIESDWNLKFFVGFPIFCSAGINRIRLEFKELQSI